LQRVRAFQQTLQGHHDVEKALIEEEERVLGQALLANEERDAAARRLELDMLFKEQQQ
jgi:hypothetical protein